MKKLNSLASIFCFVTGLLTGVPAFAGFFDEGMVYKGGVGVGLQWLQLSSSTEISKGGAAYFGLVSAEKTVAGLGTFGLGLGYQLVVASGSTSNRNQGIAVANSLIDLSWSTEVLLPGLEAGALIRNYAGPGAFQNVTDISFNWLLSLGPQFRYHWKLDDFWNFTFSTSVLLSLTAPQRTIWQVPFQVQMDLPWGKTSKSDVKPQNVPAAVTP